MRSRSPNAHPTMTTINERAESRKRICYFLFGLISSVVSFCLICVSLATNYWVQSEPYKNSSVQDISAITKGKGFLHFGLFRGSKVFDSGFGTKDRDSPISVLTYINEEALFPFALWIIIILIAVVVVILNISSTALCLLNLLTKPFRTEQGPIGVCLINIVSLLLTLLCVGLSVGVFAGWLSQNVLTKTERSKFWLSVGETRLQWSFWLLPAAAAAQLISLLCAAAAGGLCAAGGGENGGESELKLCCCCGCGRKDRDAAVNMHDVMIY